MSTLEFANNAGTTLAGGISNTATSANLASGSGALFPSLGANQYFVATLTDLATELLNEIVWVTAISGDFVTLVRAQEGTSALNWLAGDLFNNNWTAGQAATMLQQGQQQAQATNYGVDVGVANAAVAVLSPAVTANSAGMPVHIKVGSGNSNTGATTLSIGAGVEAVVRPNGSACIGGELLAGHDINVLDTGTNYQLTGIAPASASAIIAGTDTYSAVTPAQLTAYVQPGTGSYLKYSSTTSLLLAPTNGGILWINGANYQIPANLTISNSGLAPSTLYYCYAFMSAGVMTLELSTTTYAFAANGMPQKTGDATRTFVGLAYTQGSTPGQFQLQGTGTISYFNKSNISLQGSMVANSQTTSGSPVELDGGMRVYFLSFGVDSIISVVGGVVSNNVSGNSSNTYCGLDGSFVGIQGQDYSAIANQSSGVAGFYQGPATLGHHYMTPLAAVSGNTGTYNVSAIVTVKG